MSTGACMIDGVDIYTLGVIIAKGGDHGFIMFPERVTPEINDWPEEDGVEPDLSESFFQARKFTVQYYCMGDALTFKSRLNAFADLHFKPGYRSIYVREFDKTFQVRFAGISEHSQRRGFAVGGSNGANIYVDYEMDDPLQFLDDSVAEPAQGRQEITHVSINGLDLSEYGIIVRDIYSTAMKLPVKQGLITSSNYRTGQVADADYMQKDIAEVSISCTMTASSRTAFWQNYNALFNQLSAGAFRVGLTAGDKDFTCYYKGMSTFSKRPWANRVFAEFTLTIVAYGWNEMLYLLATQAGHPLITEDGAYIDMNS